MKFYQRLDWQLAVTIVVIFTLAITFSDILRQITVQIIEHELKPVERQQALWAYENLTPIKEHDPKQLVLKLKQQGNIDDYIYIVTSTELAVLADTSDDYAFIELVRENPVTEDYSVVVSSKFQKRERFMLYEDVPAVSLGLLAVPNPVDKTQPGIWQKIKRSIVRHTQRFGGYYLGILVIIVLLVRWRLRPLRELEAQTQQLSKNKLPPPLTQSLFKDEVGSLIDSFNIAVDRLKSEERHRTQMLADIAHELRTPLNNLQGRLEAQQQGIVTDTDKVLTFSYRQVQYLAQLVEDIDLMTAADYGDLSLNKEPVQVLSLIEEECNIFKANYSLHIDITGEDLALDLDALRFRQIIKNLLQNALTAKPDNLRVSVALQSYEDRVELTLEDNGPGVHEDQLDKIFERLYRVDSSRNDKTGGSGLGLSIVRQLVGLHGGEITAYLPKAGGLGLRMILPR